MRLGLVAAKPTDAVTYGLLPGDEPPAGLPYPVVLKPAEGGGQRGRHARGLGGFLTTMSALPWFVEERLTWDPLPPGEELDHVRRALGDLGVSFGACRTPGTSHTTGSSCIHPLRSIA